MTMIPHQRRHDLTAAWARFRDVTARLVGRDPEDDLAVFGEFLLLRDDLFRRLALPVTAHNSLRLYDCAEAGLSVDVFLGDVDAFLPAAIVDDEALFRSALHTYFSWRDVPTGDARVYDAEAFLRFPHHPHNAAALGAWLDHDLDWLHARAHLSRDLDFLDGALN